MLNPFTRIAVIAAFPLFVAVTACGGRQSAENQEIAARSSSPDATDTAPVEATLRRAKDSRHLEIEIKNIGTRPFTFLDIREGTACCDEFWEVEVQLASGKTLKPMMSYSPEGLPWKTSIEPGKTYVREIQPGAYVDYHPGNADEEGTIIVRYRVKHPKDWASMLTPPYPMFSTRPLAGKLTNYLYH